MAAEMFERERCRFLCEIYTGQGRCRVESEAILPDYKEEALRILCVDTRCRVNSKNIYLQGQNLICEVEGVAAFHVLYLAESQKENQIPSAFLTQENFSYTFKIPSAEQIDPEQVAAAVEVNVENNSVKLLGPRKIAMRSDVIISLNVKSNCDFDYYANRLPEDVQTKENEVKLASLCAVHQEEVSFSETIVLPKAYLPIGEICQMQVELFDQRVICEDGLVRIIGNCDIQCSYVSQEEESFISFYQPIEFEKNIKVDSCRKDQICEVIFTPNFLKATADINEEGENKNILFEVGCTAELRLYENTHVLVVEDAFSTRSHLDLETVERTCEEIFAASHFSVPMRGEISLQEEKLLRAEGIRTIVELKNSYPEDGKIAIEGKTIFRYLAIKVTGEMMHLEHSHEFKVSVLPEAGGIPENIEDCRIEISANARGVDLDLSQDKLSVRYDLCGFMMLFCRKRFLCVSSLARGEVRASEKSGMIFYYPQSGEDLWSVCKKFSVSPDKLCRENHLDSQSLPKMIHLRVLNT